jgi:hypothetical protein
VSYALEWSAVPALLGTVLLHLIVPSFALIGLVVVALAAVAALVALAGAMLAMPTCSSAPAAGAAHGGASQPTALY